MSRRGPQKRLPRPSAKKTRRLPGISPLARLDPDESCECWQSYCAQDNRMSSLYVARTLPAGGGATAFFLIDHDCLGLKDAFFRIGISPAELREMVRQQSRSGLRFVRIDLDHARKLLAAAIAWTRAHPFHLPPDTDRCLKILGGDLDPDHADTAHFGDPGGGLLYVGRKADLQRRLQIPLDDFMASDDVECCFVDHIPGAAFAPNPPGSPEPPADREAAFHSMQQRMRRQLLEAVRRWCFANGQPPHPHLEDAVDTLLVSSSEAALDSPDEDAEPDMEAMARVEHILLSMEDPDTVKGIEEAKMQLGAFMASFSSRHAMMESLGFTEDDAPQPERTSRDPDEPRGRGAGTPPNALKFPQA